MFCIGCKKPVYFDQRDYVKFVFVDAIDRYYHLDCFRAIDAPVDLLARPNPAPRRTVPSEPVAA